MEESGLENGKTHSFESAHTNGVPPFVGFGGRFEEVEVRVVQDHHAAFRDLRSGEPGAFDTADPVDQDQVEALIGHPVDGVDVSIEIMDALVTEELLRPSNASFV